MQSLGVPRTDFPVSAFKAVLTPRKHPERNPSGVQNDYTCQWPTAM